MELLGGWYRIESNHSLTHTDIDYYRGVIGGQPGIFSS